MLNKNGFLLMSIKKNYFAVCLKKYEEIFTKIVNFFFFVIIREKKFCNKKSKIFFVII